MRKPTDLGGIFDEKRQFRELMQEKQVEGICPNGHRRKLDD
jgi:hypothetical protein